ncbi:MAG: hypothetical protein R3357_08770 [Burkholderiales bacterium]|nr:hypothetical protein [Burkholderiales bacterium]
MPARLSRGLPAMLPAGVLTAAMMLSGTVSGEGADGDAAPHGRLDGMRFVGTFAPAGRNADRKDTLSFNDGHFWSAICVPCGFAPGLYWVRHVGNAIHFRGVMESPERGTFSYDGMVREGRLSATIHWRRDRWYWSVEREYRFEGKVAEARVTMRATSVARSAAAESRVAKPKDLCPL